MQETIAFSQFAPAERASKISLKEQADLFAGEELLSSLFNGVPDIFLILNAQRQIVFANRAILNFLGVEERHTLYGLRPGEAFDCVHASETMGGCGTTEFCRMCGAVNAILSSLRGKETINECRITRRDGTPLDLRVWTTPLNIDNHRFTMFAVTDISHEKRRQTMERLFFHDILNTAGGLRGISELLKDASVEEMEELKDMIYTLAERLVDEIQTQRILTAAETDELATNPTVLHSVALLRQVIDTFRNHEVTGNRVIRLDPDSHDLTFTSDRVLVGRVLGNLLKNALEATPPGDVVTLGCTSTEDTISFWVHNPSFMSKGVQLQVFQRSFSTKGSGRGLGTYSIKLLTEKYLHGTVTFTSSPKDGTKFTLCYPLHLSPGA